jgi:hypothetical protein
MEFFHQNFINWELFLLQIKNYNKKRGNFEETLWKIKYLCASPVINAILG